MNKFQCLILLTIMVLISSIERFRVIRAVPRYAVSNKGRVRTRITGRVLRPQINDRGYLRITMCGKNHLNHRLVAKEWAPNPERKACVDHIDGNPLNNYVSDLRWATYAENSRNKSKHKNSTSKYERVSKHGDKWLVDIRNQHIGLFKDDKEAAIAYNNHARTNFGVFAKLNRMD